MNKNINDLKVFSGRSNPDLSERITDYLSIPLGELTIKNFADGELRIKYGENIRGKDVFIIQSTNSPAENIIELTLLVDAAVRASAGRVTVGDKIEKMLLGFQFHPELWWTFLLQLEQTGLLVWTSTQHKFRDLLLFHLTIYIVAWYY